MFIITDGSQVTANKENTKYISCGLHIVVTHSTQKLA